MDGELLSHGWKLFTHHGGGAPQSVCVQSSGTANTRPEEDMRRRTRSRCDAVKPLVWQEAETRRARVRCGAK
eukprot:431425-Heterocapsa_arctica.AAC.1